MYSSRAHPQAAIDMSPRSQQDSAGMTPIEGQTFQKPEQEEHEEMKDMKKGKKAFNNGSGR
jgi:hypothetical protein